MANPISLSCTIPKDTLQSLGALVVECAVMDMLIGVLAEVLSGKATVDRQVLGRDTRVKIKSCIDNTTDIKLIALLNEAGHILADRNLYIHGIAMTTNGPGAPTVITAFRGKYREKIAPYDTISIDKIQSRVCEINGLLLARTL